MTEKFGEPKNPDQDISSEFNKEADRVKGDAEEIKRMSDFLAEKIEIFTQMPEFKVKDFWKIKIDDFRNYWFDHKEIPESVRIVAEIEDFVAKFGLNYSDSLMKFMRTIGIQRERSGTVLNPDQKGSK